MPPLMRLLDRSQAWWAQTVRSHVLAEAYGALALADLPNGQLNTSSSRTTGGTYNALSVTKTS